MPWPSRARARARKEEAAQGGAGLVNLVDNLKDPKRQHAVLETALGLLEDPEHRPPTIVDFRIR